MRGPEKNLLKAMQGRVLIIAGSDCSGGAGIQADIKTVTALGGYAMSAITALTVQDTTGVHGIMPIDAGFVRRQIEICLQDIGADCIKIGMLGTAEIAKTVGDILREYKDIPVVLDPVLAATSGDALAEEQVSAVLQEVLMPLASLVTPNLPEASTLTGRSIKDREETIAAARQFRQFGAKSVLVKGGHAQGDMIEDVLLDAQGETIYQNARLETASTHGTGCTLASAIATGLAQNLEMKQAVLRGISYVRESIRRAPGYGKGNGPLNHGVGCKFPPQSSD